MVFNLSLDNFPVHTRTCKRYDYICLNAFNKSQTDQTYAILHICIWNFCKSSIPIYAE